MIGGGGSGLSAPLAPSARPLFSPLPPSLAPPDPAPAPQDHLTPEQTCLAASGAKFFATVATYPTQVVRTRLQLQQASPGRPAAARAGD